MTLRRLRLFWNRWRPLLCGFGLHRWETLYDFDPGQLGARGRYYRAGRWCIFCGRDAG